MQRAALNTCIFKLTGHHIEHFKSFNDFVEFMWQPVDAACLGICRFLFGLMMLIDIPEERGGSEVLGKWADPKRCHFPLFSWWMVSSAHRMGLVYAAMWTGAFGITIGYHFRLASFVFASTYWYVFLMDTSVWNNHSYLYGLCGLLFMCSDAHRYFSVDGWLAGSHCHQEVPFWNYFILKYQFCVLYFVAGAKKLCSEWLSGYAMTNLSYHWVFSPFRLILGTEWTDLLIIHWFGCFFDLTIVFWMIFAPTRRLATVFCISFHLMNSTLFSIGMFPWVCLAELPLFYERDWPRKLHKYFKTLTLQSSRSNCNNVNKQSVIEGSNNQRSTITYRQIFVIGLMLGYCVLQAVLPYSHFITLGYNNWTDGIYGYSWDMMVHAWDTVLVVIKVRDNGTGQTRYLDPRTFTDSDRWTKHADQALQYAQCIYRNLLTDLNENTASAVLAPQLSSGNISIFFDVWCSMNGRFQQRMFDPNVDILQADWSPFLQTPWVLPLLTYLTPMRGQMTEISKTVLGWSNYSDVMFIADYPNMKLENFITADLENVTLKVLRGQIEFQERDVHKIQSLNVGDEVVVKSGRFHTVTTIGSDASCYMYTFVNRTMRFLETNTKPDTQETVFKNLWKNISKRFDNFLKFVDVVKQSIYHELLS